MSKKAKATLHPASRQTASRHTASGIPLQVCYATDQAELPGVFPFTRGIHAGMYTDRLWTMRQYAGFGTAEEANRRYRYLLSQGTSGISVAFDLPTQMGRDPDHPSSRGEVGKVGVSIASVDDMRVLFAGLDLANVSTSMTINSTAATLLAFYLVVAEEEKTPWSAVQGTVQNDILKEYLARGTYIYPPAAALRLTTDVIAFCTTEVPKWNTISISGYHIREAGSTAVQELSFTFANAIAYVEGALQRGLAIDDFAPRLAFFFNCHNDFFEEIAKFRAARRIWATLMKERFGAKKDRSLLLRFHTQTAGSSLTAQQPLNNVVRTSLQALAAVLGGTQSLHTNSYDEALGLPTEESATVALRTQQIIAHESGVASVVDPLGGSYFMESLTHELEKQVWAALDRIERLGGMVHAIEQGVPQSEIEEAAYRYQQRIESSEQIVVGVNEFHSENSGDETEIGKIDPQGEERACTRIQALRGQRDAQAASEALAALKQSARGESENIMAAIVSAARARATLGEIADSLREVFGEYRS